MLLIKYRIIYFTKYSDMNDAELSHINEQGEATMVDVSNKLPTHREATASGLVRFPPDVFEQIQRSDFWSKKGSIIQTATLAGIMAVKRTADLIPLCHPLPLNFVDVQITPAENCLNIRCTVRCHGRTGVEMEALCGVSTAALTVYDMCKALSHNLVVEHIQLDQKTGGKHDYQR